MLVGSLILLTLKLEHIGFKVFLHLDKNVLDQNTLLLALHIYNNETEMSAVVESLTPHILYTSLTRMLSKSKAVGLKQLALLALLRSDDSDGKREGSRAKACQ